MSDRRDRERRAIARREGRDPSKPPVMLKAYLQELVNHGGQAYVYHPITSRLSDVVRGDYGVLASKGAELEDRRSRST